MIARLIISKHIYDADSGAGRTVSADGEILRVRNKRQTRLGRVSVDALDTLHDAVTCHNTALRAYLAPGYVQYYPIS